MIEPYRDAGGISSWHGVPRFIFSGPIAYQLHAGLVPVRSSASCIGDLFGRIRLEYGPIRSRSTKMPSARSARPDR